MRCPSCKELLDLSGAKFCPGCGASVDPFADPLLGQTIAGRYRVSHLVAEGGMGRVYLAEQTMGSAIRKIAIKVLLAEYSGRDQDMQRFARECSTVTELEHPNTIKFFDYGDTPQGDLFIAMEYLSGPSLAQILKNGPLPPERVDLIVGQICGSLQEAHDRGIIHRDLKPDNIILTSPGGAPDFVKVLDFGIAKRTGNRDPKLTPLGVVLGSPPYMSPEQFTLQDVDHKSDVYSMGVVAYQMLTGQLPFNATDPIEWAALHMGVPPTPIDAHGVPIPPQMRTAIQRAMAKRPEDRPASMRDFYSDFTIGAGSLTPGRLSSMLPLSPSQIPLPSRLPSARPPASGSTAPPRAGSAPQLVSVPPVPLPRALGNEPLFETQDETRAPSAPRVGLEGPTSGRDSEAPTRLKPSSEPVAPRAASPETIEAPLLYTPAGITGESALRRAPVPAPAPSSPEPATIRDPNSAPSISVHELSASAISLPPSAETSSHKSGKGTIVMAASEPPARARLTMPDLLPPTVRDPSEALAAVQGGGRRMWMIALGLILVGAIASAAGWFFFLRPSDDAAEKKPRKKASSAAPAGTEAPRPTSTSTGAAATSEPPRPPASAAPSADPAPSSAPAPDEGKPREKLSPCQTAIFAAVSGKCDAAKLAYARCGEDSPYRASATRAVTGLCP